MCLYWRGTRYFRSIPYHRIYRILWCCDASRNGIWDCESAGTALKEGGLSNFEAKMSGYINISGTFSYLNSRTRFGLLLNQALKPGC